MDRTINIRVITRAKKSAVVPYDDGLKVYLAAAPIDGKANKALVTALAAHLCIKKSKLKIIKGERSRDKVVRITERDIQVVVTITVGSLQDYVTQTVSKFRDSFKLDKRDLAYIEKVGLPKIEEHALDFVIKRLAPAKPRNDGKQTPFRGHPAFKAQHATATCCRNCLYKWYAIPKGRAMSGPEIAFTVGIIVRWLKKMLNVKT